MRKGIKHRNNKLICTVDNCDSKYYCRGYCKHHYMQSFYGRIPTGAKLSDDLKLRYSRKIRVDGTCWLWTGSLHRLGYGRIRLPNGKIRGAHNVLYELYKGPIPEGLTLDHLCRKRNCVNPQHLEPVTLAENIRRAVPYWRKANCKRGHSFDKTNTYVNPLGRRICRKCTNIAGKKYHKKKLAL